MDDETFASAEEEAVEKAHIAADIAPAVYEATDVWQRRGAEVLDPSNTRREGLLTTCASPWSGSGRR